VQTPSLRRRGNPNEGKEEEEIMRRLLWLVVLNLVAVSLVVSSAWAQQGQNVTVNMEDNYFEQADITVPTGTTVTWVQAGNNPHTTTSYDGLWDSGMLAGGSGESFSYTFDEPGSYTYFCIPHESQGMVGSVTVTGGGGGGGATIEAGGSTGPLPASGGVGTTPSVLLPAVALILGSGILAYAVMRRSSV
jgi:plastocyanin